MYLKRLDIAGFKCFERAQLSLHPRLNVLTGGNNCGKTSALEAVSLALGAAARAQGTAGKASHAHGVARGDWVLSNQYVPWGTLGGVRAAHWSQLYFDGDANNATAAFSMQLGGEALHTLGVKVRSARGELLSIEPSLAQDEATRLRAALPGGPRAIEVHWSTPVAVVPLRERYQTVPQVHAEVAGRRGAQVLRNRICELAGLRGGYGLVALQDELSYVLHGRRGLAQLEVRSDIGHDAEAEVVLQMGADQRAHELAMYGSGTLQVLELLLSLRRTDAPLQVVLLDEPDSHIQIDAQKRLIEIILAPGTDSGSAGHTQVVMTTHNEALLRATPWECLLHLGPAPHRGSEIAPVGAALEAPGGRRMAPMPTPLHAPLAAVGATTAVDLLTALDSEHFFLVEGIEDWLTVQALLQPHPGGPQPRLAGWSLGGETTLADLRGIARVLELVRNGQTLRARARLVLDRDDLPPDAAALVADLLSAGPLGVQARWWPARCLEATAFSGGSAGLAELLEAWWWPQAPRDPGRAAALAGLTDHLWGALRERLRADTGGFWSVARTEARLRDKLDERILKGLPEDPSAAQRKQLALPALVDAAHLHRRRALDQGALHEVLTKGDAQWAWGEAWDRAVEAGLRPHGERPGGTSWSGLIRHARATTQIPAWSRAATAAALLG